MTPEEFIAEAKRLRSLADHAEIDFLEFLYEAEAQPNLWEGAGLDFASFVERQNLCKAIRYLAYRRVREAHGLTAVRGVGVHALIAAAKLKAPEQQRAALDECRRWEATNDTVISEQSAERIIRDVRVRDAGIEMKHKSYTTLAEENKRLRAENEELKQTCQLLRAELKSLKTPKKDKGKAA